MVTVVPAILEKEITAFEEKLKRVEELVKRVQIDIIDGKFAEIETVEPEAFSSIETTLELEGQLMVEKPENWVERCAAAGMTALYGHVEKMLDPVKFIADTQAAGMKVGLAYDIGTPIDGLENKINDLDAVLLMSVKAGSQGVEKFDERVLAKIKQVREIDKNIKIVVDGDLNVENIKRCFEAEWAEEIAEEELDRNFGKMEFAVGSDLFGAMDIKREYENLVYLRKTL